MHENSDTQVPESQELTQSAPRTLATQNTEKVADVILTSPETAESTQGTQSAKADNTTGTGTQTHNKKTSSGTVVFIIILALTCVLGLYSLVKSIVTPVQEKRFPVDFSTTNDPFAIFSNKQHPSSTVGTYLSDYIAVLKIEGTIEPENSTYNQAWLLDTVDSLKTDFKNQAILLFIDSPGGTVYEADELYLKLLEYKEDTGRPIWAYLGSMAASGGYYLACAADHIIANRNTLTGSIGVLYGPAVDLTGLLDEYGIKMTTFKAGKNKNMLNINSPVTEEQAAIMQSIVDEAYEQFTAIVSVSRDIPIKTIQQIADGRVYTAKQAKEFNLIDDIKRYEEAVDYMNTDLFGENTIDVNNIEMSVKKSLYEYILDSEMMFLSNAHKNPVTSLAEQISACPAGPAYYYQFGME